MKVDIGEISLRGRNFKAFGDEPQGFSVFKAFNIVIGRNNSGKSALLDLITAAVTDDGQTRFMHLGNRKPELLISWRLNEKHVGSLPVRAGYDVSFQNWSRPIQPREWINKLTGSLISGILESRSHFDQLKSDRSFNDSLDNVARERVLGTYAQMIVTPFESLRYRRIAADRDVQPELMTPGQSNNIKESGEGLTSALAYCLNVVGAPRQLVENTLLESLNEIFEEAEFTRISARQHANDTKWEVFLHEQHKGEIPLSQSGSGIKTILLTLANLLLVPAVIDRGEAIGPEWIFGFEELENNLHPAAQRRLFNYLRSTAETTGCRFVITTHSNVVIDMFSHDEQAQILHVTHDGKTSTVTRVDDSVKAWAVLDDMDVRASDLLQSNCVVWVEGPSDRLYFRKWVELWSNGTLQEGVHYQCLSFGGACNAHLSFDEPTQVEDLVAALKVSRNAMLLIDRDRPDSKKPLKPNTQRLIDEIQSCGGYAWLTAGREVENYIPLSILKENWNIDGKKLQYASIPELIRQSKKLKSKPQKTAIAHEVCQLLTREQLELMLDMKERLDAVCLRIRKANGIGPAAEAD